MHTGEYLEQLVVSLRVRDVPADRIREIIDELEGHLAEAGEDPREAFGEPAALADSYVQAHPVPRARTLRGTTQAAIAAGAFLAPVLLGAGIDALVSGEPVAIGLGHVLGVAVVLAAFVPAFRLLWAFLDGRGSRWSVVAVFVGGAVGGLVMALWLTGPVLVEVPGWGVLTAAVAAVATVAGLVRSDPLPPPGASATSPPPASG